MGHTYVFPTSYDLSSYVHINSYDHWGAGTNKSIQDIINDFNNLLGEGNFNALIMGWSNNSGVYGIYYMFAFNLSTDPLYNAVGPWENITDGTFAGISGVPGTAMGYVYDSGTPARLFAWHNASLQSYTTLGRTYTGQSGQGFGTANERDAIVVLLDYEGEVYLNNENVTPISYNWRPFEQLAGNGGQFRMNLSQIKEEYIGDGATTETTQDNDKFIIEPLTSLKRISGNFALDEERTIAWCGHHYATLTKHFSADTYSIRLKLYFRPELPAIYDSGYLYLFDDLDDYYLSFIYDTPHQAARVDLIHYYESEGSYWWSYNEGIMPEPESLLDVYVWLSTNGEVSDTPYDTGTTDDGGDPGTPRGQDHIYTSPLPTKSGLGLGLIGLYHPTPEQLGDIADLLWSQTLIDNVLKYFSNFADNILSLYVLPFLPANLPQKHFTVGHYATEIDNVDYVTTRYYDVDMGSVSLGPLWDSYLDYEPYSRCQIYLPYIGMKDLDIDELMCPTDINGMMPKASGCTLSLLYRLDILTGAIVAQLKISNEYLTDEIRYQYSGKVGYNIPLTGETYNGIVTSLLSVATAGASALMTGGLTAPLVDGAAIAGTIQAQKGSVTHSGNLSGDVSMMSQKTPYIEISSPNKPYLDLQENFTGFPSYKSDKLDNFSGYTQVLEVHAEGFVCTEAERLEIIRLLKEGVLL